MDNITVKEHEYYDKVLEALNGIRPYLEADGGNIEIINITSDNVVEVELLGACGSCPMSSMTMKAGVEQAIIAAVPSITAVRSING